MALTGLSERRRLLGFSQEDVARHLAVDRTTVGRWERGETRLHGHHRRKLADLLGLSLLDLDNLLTPHEEAGQPSLADPEDLEDMLRRDFLRHLAVAGSMALLADACDTSPAASSLHTMNGHLWQVYQHARTKSSIQPLVQDQLGTLMNGFEAGKHTADLCKLTADLFQLAGELAFDANRYTEAAHCYTLAASAAREAGDYDLWACALTRHAYVGLYEDKHADVARMLTAAGSAAHRGDSALATRHWVASVQAQAYAGLGDLDACEQALDEAEEVAALNDGASNGGWLRFDGSRLAEERGARYVELGRLDLAEGALLGALAQGQLAQGSSFRRRGVVLSDLDDQFQGVSDRRR